MRTVLVFGLILLLAIFGPLVTIWAVNALFPTLAIPYTWETWLAVILLKGLLTVQIKQ